MTRTFKYWLVHADTVFGTDRVYCPCKQSAQEYADEVISSGDEHDTAEVMGPFVFAMTKENILSAINKHSITSII